MTSNRRAAWSRVRDKASRGAQRACPPGDLAARVDCRVAARALRHERHPATRAEAATCAIFVAARGALHQMREYTARVTQERGRDNSASRSSRASAHNCSGGMLFASLPGSIAVCSALCASASPRREGRSIQGLSADGGVGARLLIPVHHGGEAPDLESPPVKYPKRSQYKYAKSRYRVRNWRKYEAGLRRRGDLTVWFSEDALDSWRAPPSGKPAASAPTRTSRLKRP
jgi:hypothetical protein